MKIFFPIGVCVCKEKTLVCTVSSVKCEGQNMRRGAKGGTLRHIALGPTGIIPVGLMLLRNIDFIVDPWDSDSDAAHLGELLYHIRIPPWL